MPRAVDEDDDVRRQRTLDGLLHTGRDAATWRR